MKRIEIVIAARRYLGTPFLHQGRTIHGIDCVGLLVGVAKDLGIPCKDRRDYSRQPSEDVLLEVLNQNMVQVDIAFAKMGDVIALRATKKIRHVAILSDVGMIHSWALGGIQKVAEHGLNDRWRSRIAAAFTVSGLED